MNVIICCEESQAVCIEFRKKGHNAYSCDLQKSSGGHPEWHFEGDCFEILDCGMLVLEDGSLVEISHWDLMIGHPPCTYLSNAGNGYFDIDKYYFTACDRWINRFEAVIFFIKMWKIGCKICKVCLENPIGYIQNFLPYSQIIQPYYFGDSDMKRTRLWIKGLSLLYHSKTGGGLFVDIKTHVEKPEPIYVDKISGKKRYFTDAYSGGTKESQKLRSKTFEGIAKAMAKQWG